MKAALSIVGLAGLIIASCNPFEPDQSVILHVASLDAPASITPGSSFAAVLTVQLENGCLSFDRIETQRSTSSATITVWGKDAAAGRKDVMCPQMASSETHTLQFNPPFANAFTVTVNRGRLSPLTTTVQVQ